LVAFLLICLNTNRFPLEALETLESGRNQKKISESGLKIMSLRSKTGKIAGFQH
jgi:hypothetical protein